METKIKITRLYSNDSKKARLKRKKNKFQRVWDPEKQTYVKVRKQHNKSHLSKKEIKERFGTKIESVPAPKKEKVAEKKTVVHAKRSEWKPKVTSIKMYNQILVWDDKTNRYRNAA